MNTAQYRGNVATLLAMGRVAKDVENIRKRLANLEQRLAEEEAKPVPDAARLARMQETIQNIRQSIARAQCTK